MKTQNQIDEAVRQIKENKTKCAPFTFFGDDTHAALDAMAETLEKSYDEDEVYEEFGDEGYVTEAALEMTFWKDSNDSIQDHLYPEK